MANYPIAAGVPDYSRGGSGFIPEIWSGRLLEKFYLATVFAAISNTDYEGEVKAFGDKVWIRTVPDIEVYDYVVGQSLKVQRPQAPTKELLIDKGQYFNFTVDHVLRRQMDRNYLESWSNDASQKMKIRTDYRILNGIYTKVGTKNKGATAGYASSSYNMGAAGSPVAITKANIIDYLVDCGSVLDEQNRPDTDRWFVLPNWMINLLKKSDIKDASMTGDGQSVLRNGRIGMIDRWTLYSSNNYLAVTDTVQCYHALFGHKSALSFAAQFVEMDTLKAESTFGDLVRGLEVFGYEVLQPDSIGDLYCTKG